MSEHLLTDDIERYLNRELTPAELLAADDHLARCEVCFRKVKDSKNFASDLGFLQDGAEEPEHLSYELLENYADEKADEIEREIADVHLEICTECRAELNGLIEMRKLVEADLHKQALTEKAAGRSIFAPLGEFFAGGNFLRFGFAAAALLVFALAIFWFSKRAAVSPDIAAVSPSAAANVNAPVISTTNPPSNAEIDAPVNAEVNAPANNNPDSPPAGEKKNEFPAVHQTEIERALAAERLSLPAELNELGGRGGKLMGGAADAIRFGLTAPLGKIIQTDRPQFSWRALDGATGYVVNVYDAGYNRVAGSAQLSGTSWQVDRPLARNKIYIWQVTAIKDGQEIKSPVRPAPDAKFKIIDAARANELARLSRRYKNEHLSLGILYANAGLLTEAAREFQNELRRNPNSPKARRFLRQVRRLN